MDMQGQLSLDQAIESCWINEESGCSVKVIASQYLQFLIYKAFALQ